MGEPTGQQTADSAPAEPTVEGTPQGDQGSTVPADVVPAPSAEEMPEGLGEKAQERFRTLARERTEAKGELEKMQAEVAAVKEARQKLEFDLASMQDRMQQTLQADQQKNAPPDPYANLAETMGVPQQVVDGWKMSARTAERQQLAEEERMFQERLDAAEDVARMYGDDTFDKGKLQQECWNRGLDPLAVQQKRAKQAYESRKAKETKGKEQAAINSGVAGVTGPTPGSVPGGDLPKGGAQTWDQQMVKAIQEGSPGRIDDF